MDEDLQQLVWQRADSHCEYCQFPARYAYLPFQIDHIIAQKHQGETVDGNLALSCYYCNSYKGPNIAGIDPLTEQIEPLYHPRRDRWGEHFSWNGPTLIGRTPSGRATIEVLRINHPDAVAVRQLLLEQGESLHREE